MSYKKQLLENQQLRERNLKLKVKNSNKISDAIRDVDFGIIPNIQDNRTRNEIIQDEFKTQETTIANANRLFDNNAQAVQRFMRYLGADKYLLFNRYFANIYNELKEQLPYIQDSQVNEYVLTYLMKQEKNEGIRDIIPTSDMIQEVIDKIRNMDTRDKIQKQDLLYKLEALQVTLDETKDINKSMYEQMNLPTSDDLEELLKTDDTDETIDSAVDVTSGITAPTLSKFRPDIEASLSEDFSTPPSTPIKTETMPGPESTETQLPTETINKNMDYYVGKINELPYYKKVNKLRKDNGKSIIPPVKLFKIDVTALPTEVKNLNENTSDTDLSRIKKNVNRVLKILYTGGAEFEPIRKGNYQVVQQRFDAYGATAVNAFKDSLPSPPNTANENYIEPTRGKTTTVLDLVSDIEKKGSNTPPPDMRLGGSLKNSRRKKYKFKR